MQVVFVKVDPQLHRLIVESKGEILNAMGNQESIDGFQYEADAFDELDYRDIQIWASDERHPFYDIFAGDALVEGYQWNYGEPMFHSSREAAKISQRLDDCEDEDWQVTSVAVFFRQAVLEGKGVIVGIA